MVVHGEIVEPYVAVAASADAGAATVAAVASAATSTFNLIVMAAGSHPGSVTSCAAATQGVSRSRHSVALIRSPPQPVAPGDDRHSPEVSVESRRVLTLNGPVGTLRPTR